jgi:O-antigen/teichoic acid export membrane protein
MVISLLIAVVVARILGAEGRGLLAAILLWPSVLGGVATLGVPSASAYYIRKRPRLKAAFYTNGLGVILIGAMVSALVGWLALPKLLPTLDTNEIDTARTYLLIGLPMAATFIFLGGCGQAIADMALFNKTKVLPVLVQVPVLAAIMAFGVLSAEHIAFGFLFAQATVAVWLTVEASRHFGVSLKANRVVAPSLLTYGSGVWAAEILGTITLNADKLVISHWLTLRDLGVYTLAYSLSRVVSHVPNSIAAIIFPLNVGREKMEVIRSTAQAFRLSFWPALLVALPIAIAANPLFPMVFGRDFVTSGQVFPLLVAECLISTGSWVLAQAFNSLARPGLVVARQIGGLVAFAAFAAILMPWLGIVGAAAAALAASIVRLLATLVAFRSGLGESIPSILWQRADWHKFRAAASGLVRRR